MSSQFADLRHEFELFRSYIVNLFEIREYSLHSISCNEDFQNTQACLVTLGDSVIRGCFSLQVNFRRKFQLPNSRAVHLFAMRDVTAETIPCYLSTNTAQSRHCVWHNKNCSVSLQEKPKNIVFSFHEAETIVAHTRYRSCEGLVLTM